MFAGDSGNVKFRAGLNFQSNDNQLYGNSESILPNTYGDCLICHAFKLKSEIFK